MAGLRWDMGFTVGLALVGAMAAGCDGADVGSSPASTPTPRPTATPTSTPEPTATPAVTPTPTPSHPVLAQVNMPTSQGFLGSAPPEFDVDDDDALMVSARTSIHLFAEGERLGSSNCSIEARFFVDGGGSAERVLVYAPTQGSGPLLPRDVLAEFPYTRQAAHAHWYEVVDVGSTWARDDCGDFIATYGQTALEFEGLWPEPGGAWRVLIPDITFPQEPMVWDVAPPSPDDWLLQLILHPTQR